MPTYVYRCTECAESIEVFAKMSDPPPAACEKCGAESLEKVLFPVAVHYKGSGFYSTDYKSKSGSSTSSSAGEGGSDSSSTSSSDSSGKSSGDSSSSSSSDSSKKSSD